MLFTLNRLVRLGVRARVDVNVFYIFLEFCFLSAPYHTATWAVSWLYHAKQEENGVTTGIDLRERSGEL